MSAYRRFTTALVYFVLQDDIVVNPQIIARPTLNAIRTEISFQDQFERDWVILEESNELYRFKYSFGIRMSRTILQANLAMLQTNLETHYGNIVTPAIIRLLYCSQNLYNGIYPTISQESSSVSFHFVGNQQKVKIVLQERILSKTA